MSALKNLLGRLAFANAMLGSVDSSERESGKSSPLPPLKKTNPKKYAKLKAQKQARKQSRKAGK